MKPHQTLTSSYLLLVGMVSILAAPTEPPTSPFRLQMVSQGDDGAFDFAYDTGDGAYHIQSRNPQGTVTGKFAYVAPDGRLHEVDYTADENGFRPQGNLQPNLFPQSSVDPLIPPLLPANSNSRQRTFNELSPPAPPIPNVLQESRQPQLKSEPHQISNQQQLIHSNPIIEHQSLRQGSKNIRAPLQNRSASLDRLSRIRLALLELLAMVDEMWVEDDAAMATTVVTPSALKHENNPQMLLEHNPKQRSIVPLTRRYGYVYTEEER